MAAASKIYWNDLTEEVKRILSNELGEKVESLKGIPLAVIEDEACADCKSCKKYIECECDGDESSCYYREEA